jgi:hypothetical protein
VIDSGWDEEENAFYKSTEDTVKSASLCAAGRRHRPTPYRYRLTTPVGLLDIGRHWLSLRARSVLARRPADRTADRYRKKAAAYAREAESATDETMRAYFCMMRDQWLIVAKAFESTDKNESTTGYLCQIGKITP